MSQDQKYYLSATLIHNQSLVAYELLPFDKNDHTITLAIRNAIYRRQQAVKLGKSLGRWNVRDIVMYIRVMLLL